MAGTPVGLLVCAGASLLLALLAAGSLGADSRFGALEASTGPAVPVQYRRAEPVAPDALVATLAARGYRDVASPRRKGAYYVVDAVGRHGERATLIVDAWTGDISGLRRRAD